MGELIFNGIMLVFFVAMTIYSGSIEIWQGYSGARYWPMVLLVIADLIFLLKTYKLLKTLPKEDRKVELGFIKQKNVQKLLLAFVVTAAYAGIMELVGFVIATFLYAIALSMILGLHKPAKLVLSSFVITMAIYAIFVWGLDIMVPRGQGALYYFGLWLETLI